MCVGDVLGLTLIVWHSNQYDGIWPRALRPVDICIQVHSIAHCQGNIAFDCDSLRPRHNTCVAHGYYWRPFNFGQLVRSAAPAYGWVAMRSTLSSTAPDLLVGWRTRGMNL